MKSIIFILLATLSLCVACDRFLEEKSDSALAIPETLEDNQALLDRYYVLGINATSGEVSAGDIYITDADFNNLPAEAHKRLYTWQPDRVSIASGNDWENVYAKINIFNTVLYNIEYYNIEGAANVRGQALVLRASCYLEAAQLWCLGYDSGAAQTRGLPLRLDPDMGQPSVRSSLEQTYAQILADLHAAADLLPITQIAITRPSRITALAYLSRTYLYMGNYEKALQYGLAALELNNQLLDYNSLNPASSYPIPEMNAEILLPTTMGYSPLLTSTKAKVEPSLYQMYADNDLRKTVFFKTVSGGAVLFKGNYSGNSGRMTCIATDEMYLTVAEAYARLADLPRAMNTLNLLLEKRFKAGTFVPFTAGTASEAVGLIREERRKELLFRGLRWADLKRYNKEGAGITLTRTVNGSIFTLPPNDLRYAIAIPEDIIEMTGMPQNER